MKGLCLYVNAGKGHFVPARAVHEQLEAIGVESRLEEFFSYLDIKGLAWFNQTFWRMMLRIPFLERHVVKSIDHASFAIGSFVGIVRKTRRKKLLRNFSGFRPDFIFCTHPYPERVLSALVKDLGLDIPVYYYATDVFTAPCSSVSADSMLYVATEEGIEEVVRMGQPRDRVKLCPFPLQSSVASQPRLSKAEARQKLELDEGLFTIQLNLGGEGLGSLTLLEDIISNDLPVQVVIVGGIHKNMKDRLEQLATGNDGRKTKVIVRGFVSNVSEYLAASDIIAGRAGINTILEAIYAHRPFLITELVYTVIPSARFVEKHGVGWNASDDRAGQLSIVKDLISNPQKLDQMEECFDRVPIEYSARKLAEMVVEDTGKGTASIM